VGAVVYDQPETSTLDIVGYSSAHAPKSDARDGNVCVSHNFLVELLLVRLADVDYCALEKLRAN